MTLLSEIQEQPQRLEGLLNRQKKRIEESAAWIHAGRVDYVFIAARGTSDNAGRYANYLWGALNGLPVALATPSLLTFYKKPPRLRNALVVGISQSGQSPDIVGVLAEGARQGCPTLAITNAPDSPLAQVADFVIDIRAGVEAATAATKTYTAELMAIAMLSVAMEDALRRPLLAGVPDWATQVLKQEDEASPRLPHKVLGIHAFPVFSLKLDGVQIPVGNRLGGIDGHDIKPIIASAYLANAALAVGVSRAALEYSSDYAKDREVFGMKVAQKQAIAFMIAEMATEIAALRLLVWEGAWMLDNGKDDAYHTAYLAATGAADMAMVVTDRSVQILGGHGYIREHPVEVWMRNGRGFAMLNGLAMV